jgi:hypothetical protein
MSGERRDVSPPDVGHRSAAVDVVVGGGLAGRAAALTAAERGTTVLLLEKGPDFGGYSVRSGGELLFSWPSLHQNDDVKDYPDAMRAEIRDRQAHEQSHRCRYIHRSPARDLRVALRRGRAVQARHFFPRCHPPAPRDGEGRLCASSTGGCKQPRAPSSEPIPRRGACAANGRVSGILVNTPKEELEISVGRAVVLVSGLLPRLGYARARRPEVGTCCHHGRPLQRRRGTNDGLGTRRAVREHGLHRGDLRRFHRAPTSRAFCSRTTRAASSWTSRPGPSSART